MSESDTKHQPATDTVAQHETPAAPQEEELKLSELLILASMWMLFGFMLWFYLSAFHGAPARMIADHILSEILGDSFRQIIVEPNQNFLFQVETNIQYVFKDGTQEALGFIVNPLVYSYGLPLLFGLVMGSDVSWLRKAVILLIGYASITLVQVWGVVFRRTEPCICHPGRYFGFNGGPGLPVGHADPSRVDTHLCVGADQPPAG